ncbi:MAG: FKBP-type peptidyl-prolyl cis-trans isomerase [Terriglobales bacterium]
MQSYLITTFILAAGMMLAGDGNAQQTPASTSAATTPANTTSKEHTKAAPGFTSRKEKFSYALGMNIGSSLGANLKKQSVDVDWDLVVQGLKESTSGGKTRLTEDEAKTVLAEVQSEVQKQQQAKAKEGGEKNKTEGEAFLAANKSKEGVVTLPDGLQYKILTGGTGPKPTATDSVVCTYRGTLINGTEFDSSYKRGQPATFGVGQVIKGWTEALQLMPVGSKWQLFIPSSLAYGERGAGTEIGPNATLIFEVELLSIQDKNRGSSAARIASQGAQQATKAPVPTKEVSHVLSAEEKAALLKQAELVQSAVNQQDFDTMMKFEHPAAFSLVGKDAFERAGRAAMAQAKEMNFKYLRTEFGEPSATYQAGKEEICFVPRTQLIEVQGKKFNSQAYWIAIRTVGESEWKFVDGAGIENDRESFWTMFPELPRDIRFPEWKQEAINP